MAGIRNLVFDLGNVIIDIDVAASVAGFQKYATGDFGKILSYEAQHHLFDDFDTGAVNANSFRTEIRKFLKPGTSDEQIDNAWNMVIRHFPPEKFEMLRQVKKRYPTFALSNINEIHVQTVKQGVNKYFGEPDIHAFFTGVYYSCLLGYRKPDIKIFEILLQQEKLDPARTFFVDDKPENVETAKMLGFQAYYLPHREKLFELMESLKIL